AGGEGGAGACGELDPAPQPLTPMRPASPPLAMRQRATATVVLSALISETGDVIEVKVLKGDPRFGFNDAAVRAMRTTRFSAPVKDGKHVRTWRPQSFLFNP